jgi:surfactin synthase thioesterase subunit
VTGKTTWLPRTPSPAATGRVFCIPYAGCGASAFRKWPRERDRIEFLPVELPGRETRLAEPAVGSFQDLAEGMIGALTQYLDVPFAFFGHCWSALAAYEVTTQLHQAGMPIPERLFISSQVAPQDGPVGRMLGMDDAGLTTEVTATIRALGGQPHPDLVAIYASVLRADVDASRRYIVPGPFRVSCPITAIGWTDDEEVRPCQMAGWSGCGETVFQVFAGRHHRFLDAPEELLGILSRGLGRW